MVSEGLNVKHSSGLVIPGNSLMENVPNVTFHTVRLNFGGEILKDKKKESLKSKQNYRLGVINAGQDRNTLSFK